MHRGLRTYGCVHAMLFVPYSLLTRDLVWISPTKHPHPQWWPLLAGVQFVLVKLTSLPLL